MFIALAAPGTAPPNTRAARGRGTGSHLRGRRSALTARKEHAAGSRRPAAPFSAPVETRRPFITARPRFSRVCLGFTPRHSAPESRGPAAQRRWDGRDAATEVWGREQRRAARAHRCERTPNCRRGVTGNPSPGGGDARTLFEGTNSKQLPPGRKRPRGEPSAGEGPGAGKRQQRQHAVPPAGPPRRRPSLRAGGGRRGAPRTVPRRHGTRPWQSPRGAPRGTLEHGAAEPRGAAPVTRGGPRSLAAPRRRRPVPGFAGSPSPPGRRRPYLLLLAVAPRSAAAGWAGCSPRPPRSAPRGGRHRSPRRRLPAPPAPPPPPPAAGGVAPRRALAPPARPAQLCSPPASCPGSGLWEMVSPRDSSRGQCSPSVTMHSVGDMDSRIECMLSKFAYDTKLS